MHKFLISLLFLPLLFIAACQSDETAAIESNEKIQTAFLQHFSDNIVLATYSQMSIDMQRLKQAGSELAAERSDQNLQNAKNTWSSLRANWEQSEAFLFGPVSTENIDPATDTWPIDLDALNKIINNDDILNQEYVNLLGDEQKGYHPIEFLLWGESSRKIATDFTDREFLLLGLLVDDLANKINALNMQWSPDGNNFAHEFASAGTEGSVYSSQRKAFEEVIGALIGICDEVANGKMTDPFLSKNPSLEESPFSQNSIIDFRNNIIGVKNVYLGQYKIAGTGLAQFIENNNLSLHASIKHQIENTIKSFDAIDIPFGQAIINQPTQVQNVIDQINMLKNILDDELLPFVQRTIIN